MDHPLPSLVFGVRTNHEPTTRDFAIAPSVNDIRSGAQDLGLMQNEMPSLLPLLFDHVSTPCFPLSNYAQATLR